MLSQSRQLWPATYFNPKRIHPGPASIELPISKQVLLGRSISGGLFTVI